MSFAQDEDAVVKAHDTLIAIIMGELPDIEIEATESMRGAADVLCWLLGHEHNEMFQDNLDKIEAYLTSHGMVRVSMPDVFIDPDPEL